MNTIVRRIIILSCTLAILIPLLPITTAQFQTRTLAGCAPGYDCVGTQLSRYVGPTRETIDCVANADRFVGYTCAGTHEGIHYDFLQECNSGQYCPDPAQSIKCPAGSWCHRGSTNSLACRPGEMCPEGTYKPRFLTPFIMLVILAVGIPISYFIAHRLIAKKYAARAANRAAEPQNHAIRVKGVRSQDSSTQPKLNLEFEHVSVTVKNTAGNDGSSSAAAGADESASLNKGVSCISAASPAQTKTILSDITGRVRGGRLTAVMGPSGSGKTTFLNALLNKVPISSGKVTINHSHTVQEVIGMNIVGYVPQSDTMLDMLTVRDLIEHSAFMRLPGEMPRAQKLQRVAQVMELLGITHIADSVVGDDMNRGVSGGEKKRVSIAMELVADPLILFLDEPTSGLDSAAALQVCDGLLAIAHQAKVVCCVIHQPRWEIFSKFEDVLLLGKGGLPIYFGPVRGMRDFFASMGFIPPPNCNPADFYLDTISEDSFLEDWKTSGGLEGMKARAVASGKHVPQPVVRIHLAGPESTSAAGGAGQSSVSGVELDVDVPTTIQGQASKSVPIGEEEKLDSNQLSRSNSVDGMIISTGSDADRVAVAPSKKLGTFTSHTPIVPNKPASFLTQLWQLMYRNMLVDCRSGKLVGIDSWLQIIPALGLGVNALGEDRYFPPLPGIVAETCIDMVSTRCDDYLLQQQGLTVSSFFYTMIIPVGAVLFSVNSFGRPMSVYFRDRVAGMNPTAYFLSKVLYDIIHLLRMCFIFIAIFFLMTGPRGGYGYWWATVGMVFWASMGTAYFVSIVVPFKRAAAIAVVSVISFAVTSGLLPSLTIVKDWSILQVFWYLSYNRWAAEAFIILDNTSQPTDGRMQHAITAAGFDSANLSIDIGLVFVIGILWRIAAYVALLRAKPRTEF